MVTVINHLPVQWHNQFLSNEDLVNRELPQRIDVICYLGGEGGGWGTQMRTRTTTTKDEIFFPQKCACYFTNKETEKGCLLSKFSHNALSKVLLIRIRNFSPHVRVLYFIFTLVHSFNPWYHFKYHSRQQYTLYLLPSDSSYPLSYKELQFIWFFCHSSGAHISSGHSVLVRSSSH